MRELAGKIPGSGFAEEGVLAERMAENFSPVKLGEHEVRRKAAPIGGFLSVTGPHLEEGSWFRGVFPLDLAKEIFLLSVRESSEEHSVSLLCAGPNIHSCAMRDATT